MLVNQSIQSNPVTSLCHFETAVEFNIVAVKIGPDSDSLSTLLGLGKIPTQTQSIGLRVSLTQLQDVMAGEA